MWNADLASKFPETEINNSNLQGSGQIGLYEN